MVIWVMVVVVAYSAGGAAAGSTGLGGIDRKGEREERAGERHVCAWGWRIRGWGKKGGRKRTIEGIN